MVCKIILKALLVVILKLWVFENEYTKFYDEWMKDYQVDIVNEMLANKQAEEKELEKIASGGNNGTE